MATNISDLTEGAGVETRVQLKCGNVGHYSYCA